MGFPVSSLGNAWFPQISQLLTSDANRCALPVAEGAPGRTRGDRRTTTRTVGQLPSGIGGDAGRQAGRDARVNDADSMVECSHALVTPLSIFACLAGNKSYEKTLLSISIRRRS
jgi:hypothetical protein